MQRRNKVAKPGTRRAPRVAEELEEIEQAEPGTRVVVVHTDLEAIVAKMAVLKAEAKAFNEQNSADFFALEEKCIDLMRQYGLTSYDGEKVSSTLVEPHTTVVDWVSIEGQLTPREWQAVSTRKGDEKKLDSFLKANSDRAKRLLRYIKREPKKAYVKAGLK